jgi:hypothetical protein
MHCGSREPHDGDCIYWPGWLDFSRSESLGGSRLSLSGDSRRANALRRLAHRWLKIIYKMWIDRTPYNAELHHRNQLQHGSWIFQLQKS